MKFRHSGDLGDIVYSLSVISEIKGKHDIYLVDRPFTKKLSPNFELIESLLKSQPYINSVAFSEEEPDVDLSLFRKFHNATKTLVAAMGDYTNSSSDVKINFTGEKPWLTAKKASASKGRVVVARSSRYHNAIFCWDAIVKHYGDRILFIGIDDEYSEFCRSFGNVERKKISDYSELAQVINGADLFIGNQSSPMSIAMGLGKDLIQEVCLWQPDCVYKRDNAQYSANGGAKLPDVSGSGELVVAERAKPTTTFNTCIVPPGGWQYPKLPSCTHFKIQQRHVVNLEKCTEEEAKEKLAMYNLHRIPEFFRPMNNDLFGSFNQAYERAFKTKTTTSKQNENSGSSQRIRSPYPAQVG